MSQGGSTPATKYEGLGKLAAFTLFGMVLAFALVIAFAALDLPSWLAMLVIFVLIFLIAWAVRRRESGRWSYEVRHYLAEVEGRRVELVFDERLALLNRLTLEVDGQVVDSGSIFYGRKTLGPSGEPPVSVEVGSGWVGTCTGAVARSGGEEQPMREVAPGGAGPRG